MRSNDSVTPARGGRVCRRCGCAAHAGAAAHPSTGAEAGRDCDTAASAVGRGPLLGKDKFGGSACVKVAEGIEDHICLALHNRLVYCIRVTARGRAGSQTPVTPSFVEDFGYCINR